MKEGFLTTATVTISTILGYVTSFVSEAIEWVGSFAELITGNPLLLMFTIVAFVGLGVGLIRRLISL